MHTDIISLHARRGRLDGALPLLNRLETLVRLTPEEAELVQDLPAGRRYKPGEEIVGERQAGRGLEVITTGWAARQRVLGDGCRQIVGFSLPGDFLGSPVRPNCATSVPTVAISTVETIDATGLRHAVSGGDSRFMGLQSVCALALALDHALMVEHIVRLGRLTAYHRTGHLLLELQARLVMAGVLTGWRFPIPLTQEALADHLGLSIVHVNRTLQQLRREKMIELRAGWVTILQPETLIAMTDFKLPVPTDA